MLMNGYVNMDMVCGCVCVCVCVCACARSCSSELSLWSMRKENNVIKLLNSVNDKIFLPFS